MSGVHWLQLVIIAGGSIAAMAIVFYVTERAHLQRRRLRFTCPTRGELVECTLVRDRLSGNWLSVKQCTARERSPDLLCHEECRNHLNRGALRVKAGDEDGGRLP